MKRILILFFAILFLSSCSQISWSGGGTTIINNSINYITQNVTFNLTNNTVPISDGLNSFIDSSLYENTTYFNFNKDIYLPDSISAITGGDYGLKFWSTKSISGEDAYIFDTDTYQDVGQNAYSFRADGQEYITINDGGTLGVTPFSGYTGINIDRGGVTGTSLFINNSNNAFFKQLTGIEIDGSTLGSLSSNTGIIVKTKETGFGSSGILVEGDGRTPFVMNFEGNGNPTAHALQLYVNSMNSQRLSSGLSASSSSDNFNGVLIRASVSGSAPIGDLFLGEDDDNEYFRVTAKGNIIFTSGLVHPRGTFGVVENMVKYSEEFEQSSVWSTTGAIVINENTLNAPDGTPSSADFLNVTGTFTLSQTISGTTSNKNFSSGVWVYGVTSNQPITMFIESTNEVGSSIQINKGSWVNKWVYYTISHNFSSNSTGSPKISIEGAGGKVYLWGLEFSETTKPIGYTKTQNYTIPSTRGIGVNGNLVIPDLIDNSGINGVLCINDSNGQIYKGNLTSC